MENTGRETDKIFVSQGQKTFSSVLSKGVKVAKHMRIQKIKSPPDSDPPSPQVPAVNECSFSWFGSLPLRDRSQQFQLAKHSHIQIRMHSTAFV